MQRMHLTPGRGNRQVCPSGASEAIMEESERSFIKIEPSDLERLALLCREDREEFFARHPKWQRLYSDRILCIALCQGGAVHYVNGENGVKDFDIWTFYAEHPDASFPWRLRRTKDYGLSKFGKHPADVGYIGRRVDLLARSLRCGLTADPVQCVRSYLAGGRTKTASELSRKAVVLIEPQELIGQIIWPQ
jgi:hypothetical protein